MNLLFEFDASAATLRHTYEMPAGPTYLARTDTPDGVILAAAARTRLYLLDPTHTEPWAFDLPMCYPGTQTERTTTARSITSLTWADSPQRGPELIVTTAGGMAMAVRLGERRVEEVRGIADGLGIILVTHVYVGPDGPRIVLGTRDGELRVIDVVSGRLIHDLTKDDPRIAGAATIPNASGGTTLVTAHCDRDVHRVTGLRIWDLEAGVQQHGIVRSATSDPYVGPPRPGRTREGVPFVAYLVEDGVEVTLLHDPPRRVYLPLPVTTNDLQVADEILYTAGGGGYIALSVSAEDTNPIVRSSESRA